jgi:hypothetical protein
MGQTKASIPKRRPQKATIRKGLPESLPTSVQKSYFMLGDKERSVLNIGLQKYRSGQSDPIFIGGPNLLKPALRLMSLYRLRIDEIQGDKVMTSYTRWLGSVQTVGTENQEVYVSFSPLFERIWLETKKTPPGVRCRETCQYWVKEPIFFKTIRLGEKVPHRSERSGSHWKTCERCSGWSR